MKRNFWKIFLSLHLLLLAIAAQAQYTDNPLTGEKWLSLGAGANSADSVSWQVMGNWSSRGEYFLNQIRVAYSQELLTGPNDPFSFRKNRLAEVGYMLGDGWRGDNWYATASAGFGLDLRMFGDSADYKLRYVTVMTPAIPAQIDIGVLFGKKIGAGISLVGNFNFRQSYYGAILNLRIRVNS